ncbi:MAG: MBL fold metallo-hydrolase [Xanthobacteraceae bacterium]|nr:MAG: MBL fold metallo-hydrolase [Xanthobacteraceae bacterium]
MQKAGAAIIPVTPFQQNCTLIWCARTMKAAVFDPGGDLDAVAEAIREAGVTVERILLTHGHIDHAGGAADLRERLGVPVEGPHRDEAFLLSNLAEAGAAYGVTGARDIVPDRWLDDGDRVTVGDLAFDVVHCPGHSPGSVVYVCPELRIAVVGDVLFNGSIGRSDLPGGDHATLIGSITRKLLPLGDDITFVSGHGPTSTFGHERATNPFLVEGGLYGME